MVNLEEIKWEFTIYFVFLAERRVSPEFSVPPETLYEVMLNADLNLTCVAVGSPMPTVR